ncbi:hypothetical protein [Pontiella sulfatireligans]|uniref:Uncharacterized protein n=1 Tax=Pontiella sulfatireligans TaxID=2750658 RepID=A0A6C2UR32_9BACT|nr:hypothetical protein [Pontiella sulfatireligans]VGO22770.1 hypothetical protein SCARR_04866 [Pontiella sulfatireligans]
MQTEEHRIPLPEIFWSFETGQPMGHCSVCGCDLMEGCLDYQIEKAFKDGETIFEAAVCTRCQFEVFSELSEKSREQITRYFTRRISMHERTSECLERFGTDHRKWIAHCLIKGYPLEECGEYQLYGYCSGGELVFNGAPHILSGEVIEEITDLLSAASLGVLGKLSDRLFGIDAPKDLLII